MQVNFSGYQCNLSFGQYRNGAKAISLVSVTDGSPVAVATVNVERHSLNDNEVLIKDYSENTGMLKALQEANVIDDVLLDVIESGYVEIPCYSLTDEALEAFKEAKK